MSNGKSFQLTSKKLLRADIDLSRFRHFSHVVLILNGNDELLQCRVSKYPALSRTWRVQESLILTLLPPFGVLLHCNVRESILCPCRYCPYDQKNLEKYFEKRKHGNPNETGAKGALIEATFVLAALSSERSIRSIRLD